MRNRLLGGLAVLLTLLMAASAAQAVKVKNLPGADGANVSIRTASHGVPHIIGKTFRDLAYGYAYSFARDNICTIAKEYVTVRAERSRFFGPDKTWAFEGNGTTNNNLNSDFFFQRIIDRGTVESLLAKQPPNGPKPDIKRAVTGYVAGYNRYLKDTRVARLPDPSCRGEPWVRPIREIDVYRYFYMLALLASGGVAIDGIGSAQPPGPSLLSADAKGPTLKQQERMIDENRDRFQVGAIGSNAIGLGREATTDGHGMVLGNPHFPWQGAQRFYQSQLTVPGKVDVAGASLFGVPIILIGHTRKLAWSHTVSTARRFVLYQETLVPGSPTSYLDNGTIRKMRADTVTVKVPGAGGKLVPMTRTLYSTRHGPITTSLLGLGLFPWSPAQAHSMEDANAANFRYLNHFFDVDQAQSVHQLDAIERRYQAIPWVTTTAADSTGEAYFADIGTIPHVTNAQANACSTPLGGATLRLLGVPILDGSRATCDTGTDPDSVQPGTFGASNLPSIFRPDYVTNSNDSYWLANPKHPIEGYARIIGDERAPRSLRTRLGLRIVQQRLDGTDGQGGKKFTLRKLQDAVFNDRQYAGELLRDQLVAFCRTHTLVVGTAGPVNVADACPVLAAWDLHDNLDSRGAVLFRRIMAKLLPLPGPLAAVPANSPTVFSGGFDYRDAVNTPRGLSTGNPLLPVALADGVKELRDSGIPLNARLREYQYEPRGDERIPIHGGPGTLGVFNAISDPFKKGKGFPDVGAGSSFVMAAHLNGTRCPDSRSILTYSQSASPRSPFYADQTRMFSRKAWNDMRFCPEELLRDKGVRVTELGCVSGTGFKGAVRVRGGRRRLRIRFKRRLKLPVRIEVRRGRSGKRVLSTRRSKSFTLRRRFRAGTYFVRVAATGAPGETDSREFAFKVKGGRARVSKRPFSRRLRCSLLRSATLGTPVTGGTARVRYRLARKARVTIRVLRGKRVVKRLTRTRRFGSGSARLGVAHGSYRVKITARAGKRRSSATLFARR